MGVCSKLLVILTHYNVFLFIFLSFLLPAKAAGPLSIDPTLRSGDHQEHLLEKDRKTEPSPEISAPEIPPPVDPENKSYPLGPRINVMVTRIKTMGNTIFSDVKLAAIARPFLNQKLHYEDLESIRQKLTLHYVQNGYVNSGALLPDQKITGGVVTYVIIEGALTAVDVRGNRWLRDWFYESRIKLDSSPPVNIHNLEQRLQTLQQHTIIEKLQAEFKPGFEPGQSILSLKVEERPPYKMWTAFNNYQAPSIGAERGLVTLKWQSLTGIGDALDITYGRSIGLDPLFDIGYRLPFTPWDTELGMRYRQNDFGVIEEPFQNLDIKSESKIIELKLRQPVWRTPNQEIAVGVVGERLYSKSALLDIPFSFSPGPIEGKSTVAALRFFQEYLYRSRQQVLAGHSRFSIGLDTFEATIHDNGYPDGQFFTWLGQFQYARIITPLAVQTILRTDIQLADQPLLALEQLPMGGRYSVRGYRENQLVRDNGVIASLETRIPLAKNAAWADALQVVPFFDYGQAWYAKASTPEPDAIYSIGVGLRWSLTIVKTPMPLKIDLEFYWGYPLEKIINNGDNLQDDGIHFQLAISAF